MIPPGIGPGSSRCKRDVLPLDYGISVLERNVYFLSLLVKFDFFFFFEVDDCDEEG